MKLNTSFQKLISLVLVLFINVLNSQQTAQEDLALLEAKKRNIQTQEEAIIELNKNGISIEQASEMARKQGVDLNSFLSRNFKSVRSTNSQTPANEIISSIEVANDDNVVLDTLINVKKEIFDPNLPYFGYSIFDNNPFASKNYLTGNIDEGYLLAPGDELRITVYGNNALSTISKIDLNGNIIFNDLGVFQAAGNTLKNLKSRLKIFLGKFYSGLVSNPEQAFLDISLTQIRPVSINVLGEANTPGPHLVNGLASVLNALYAAGGVKTSGSLRKIMLYRNNKLIKTMDLYDYITQGKIDSDIRLMSSDIIFIPPRISSITLSGKVKSSGIYELKNNETLEDLIKFSGNLDSDASIQNINISRIIPFEEREQKSIYDRYLTTISLNKNKNLRLLDQDEVRIKPVDKKILNIVEITGNVINPGTYSLLTYPDLKSLIENGAKGIAPNTFLGKVDIIKEDFDGNKNFSTYNLNSVLNGDVLVDLELDDVVKVYSLLDVEGEKKISVTGFGVDDKTIFWRDNLSVFDIIFESTSFNELSFKSKVLMSRVDVDSFNPSTGQYQTKVYDLNNLIQLKKILVSPKDNIRIYSKSVTENIEPKISVVGDVRSPKEDIDLNDNMVIEDALLIAGGFKQFALQDEVNVIRKLNFSQTNNFSQNFKVKVDKNYLLGITDYPETPFYLQDYDRIIVRTPKRDDVSNPSVSINGEVNFPGEYSFPYSNYTIMEFISESGGISEYGFLMSSEITDNSGTKVAYSNIRDFNNFRLDSGFSVRIGSILDNVIVTGNGIFQPTEINWNKSKRAKYYIKTAGGKKKRIDSKIIVRKNGSQKKIGGIFSNPKVFPGDLITITQKPEKEKSEGKFIDEFTRIFGTLTATLTTVLLIQRL